MPGRTLRRDTASVVGSGLARTERMERKTTAPGIREPEIIVFSYPGTLTANIESPPWYPFHDGTIQLIRVSLLAAASTNHVIEVRVNGAAIQQFTLTTGNLTTSQAAAIKVAAGSYVTIKTITVVDANLSVTMSLR